MSTTEVGDFGYKEVYINHNGIANVISLFKLGKKYYITYNSFDHGKVFVVHTPCGIVEFAPTTTCLHIVDLNSNPDAAILLVNDVMFTYSPLADPLTTNAQDIGHHLLVKTFCHNYEGFTKQQVENAAHACCLMGMVASPSEQDFQAMVHLNM